MLASQLSGLAAPWIPQKVLPTVVRDVVAPAIARRLDIASEAPIARWPIIEDALRWLRERRLADTETLAGVAKRAWLDSQAYRTIVDEPLISRLNDAVEESIRLGEGAEQWRQRLAGEIDVARHVEEVVQRTAMHRSYHAGLESSLADPLVGEQFPYYEYVSTKDTRTRPSHREMNGKVAHRDSPLAARMQSLLNDYNCRCTVIPLSRAAAASRGIDDDAGWHDPVVPMPESAASP